MPEKRKVMKAIPQKQSLNVWSLDRAWRRSCRSVALLAAVCAAMLASQRADAVLIAITNPDYDPAVSSNTNGWSNLTSLLFFGEFGVDTFNAPGSTGGALYFGDVTTPVSPPAV